MRLATLVQINEARRQRKSCQILIDEKRGSFAFSPTEPLPSDPLAERHRGASMRVHSQGPPIRYARLYRPEPRLVIVGAVHIAQGLVEICAPLGFALRVIDPRERFATPERFPNTHLNVGWPDETLARHPLDQNDALVALSHRPEIDDQALALALKARCFYIGALGSGASHRKRRERLGDQGFNAHDLDRIEGPVGMDIGAACAREIALAIAASLVRALRKGNR